MQKDLLAKTHVSKNSHLLNTPGILRAMFKTIYARRHPI